MRFLTALFITAIATMTLNGQTKADDDAGVIHVSNVYMFETAATMPAAAVFLTLMNHGNNDDRMIDFKIDGVEKVELHTMSMDNDVMKMRRVDGYDVAAGGTHELKPMGDHIMVFGLKNDVKSGDELSAIATFEKAGNVPVSIHVKARGKAQKESHHDHN